MLCEVMQAFPRDTFSKQTSVLANRAEMFIRTHMSEPISTSVIAEELKCNPDYLGRVFQGMYKKTIVDRIHECRLHKAHLLLLGGTHNIDEIARLCGYDDVRYFRQRFKKWKGMTPTAYRRLFTQVHINT
jgi:AraC-like DNA-binding protein